MDLLCIQLYLDELIHMTLSILLIKKQLIIVLVDYQDAVFQNGMSCIVSIHWCKNKKSIKIVLPFIAYFVRLTGIKNCGSKILNRLLFPWRFSFYKHFCAFLLAILGNKISSRSNGIGRFPRSLLFSMFAFKEFTKHLKGLHGMGITNLVLSFNLHFAYK